MPPNVWTETKMTVVSRPEDHTREIGSIVPNEQLMAREELSWVGRLAIPAFVIDDRSFCVMSWNTQMEKITGITAQRIQSHPIRSLLDEGSKQRLTAAVQQITGGGEASVFTIFLVESGTCLLLNITAYRSSQEKTTQIVCFGNERRARDIEPPEALLQTCFPMVSIGPCGQITGWNPSLETLAGHLMNDVIGRSFFEFVPKRDQQTRLRQTLSLTAKTLQSRSCIIDVGLQNGDLKTMLVSVSADLSQASNSNTAHYLILSDASDLGEQDACDTISSTSALHVCPSSSGDEELRQLIENSNVAIFGIDVQGEINEWNRQTVETTGFTRSEAMRKDLVGNFIPPNLQFATEEVLQNALRGRGTSNLELEILGKDGETRYLLTSVSPKRDYDEHVVGAVIFAQDITESSKHDRAVVSMANELRKLIDTANAPIFGIDKDG